MTRLTVKTKALVGEARWLPYVLPFGVFMLFTAPVEFFPSSAPFLYVLKTVTVGILLWIFRHRYKSDLACCLSLFEVLVSVALGLAVLIIWIKGDGLLPFVGKNSGFNPFAYAGSGLGAGLLIFFRLLGAALVVPIMEELFWRAFLMRYLINPHFDSVPMGTFTWFSFISVAVVFGLEHHRVVEGIIAGMIYGLIVVWQKRLTGAVIAHATTNLGLGIYVLLTGSWQFW